jgi:uncharacterized protein YkwD
MECSTIQCSPRTFSKYGAPRFFKHSQLVELVREKGYPSSFVGENIGAGSPTAERVVQMWMNSPGHRNNILNADYQEIGVGHYYLENDPGRFQYKHYWTQIFGKP